jgi:hypothetical protein
LLAEESKWRLKSRAIWIREGDNNTNFFHKFASYRRIVNSIWEIKNQNGHLVSSIEDIAEVGKGFFSNLFKELVGSSISKIIKVIKLFPRSFYEDMNDSLQDDIFDREILSTMSSFQRSKSSGPDGLIVEFYLGLYDFLKHDLLKMVQESQRSEKMWGSFNLTFIALIPKKKDLTSFEDFRPISCCNMIYKLIAKIIANHLKPIFSEIMYEEQYGFLYK